MDYLRLLRALQALKKLRELLSLILRIKCVFKKMEQIKNDSHKQPLLEKQQEAVADKRKIDRKVKWILVPLSLIALVVFGCFFYINNVETSPKEDDDQQSSPIISGAFAQKFADYEEIEVDIDPQIPAYSTDRDLSNIINRDDYNYLSNQAKEMLAKNNFVVVLPSYDEEFFPVYESLRYNHVPAFITSDSILHNYHLAFDYLLRDLEKTELTKELTALVYDMLKISQDQYIQLKGTEWENAAKRNVAFFSVVDKILYPSMEIPSYVKDYVDKELNLIEDHEIIFPSFVMNMGTEDSEDALIQTPQGVLPLEKLKEDYSQYIPRGHYTKSNELKMYFKAMMYLGRMTFRLKSEDETRSALLMTIALSENEETSKSWDRIYEPTVFFVGKADDISYYDYENLIEETWQGESLSIDDIVDDEKKFESFMEKAKKLSPPQINSMPIFDASFQPDREGEIKGFRFMGQRFTIDASIFQRLIYREVGDKTKDCESFDPRETDCLIKKARCLPKGLDIPATMGSGEAEKILEDIGETQYACYSENMSRMNEYISGLDVKTWTQNLYWGWLYSLNPLLKEKGEGWPSFMTNEAWLRKDLTTYLSSWTELKHDTILYAKQAYAELGGGPPEERDDRGYVEPNVYVYSRLSGLIKMLKEGLQVRSLLSEQNAEFLDKMYTLVIRLKEISEKELNNEKLNDDDYDLIRGYGGALEHFWLEAFKDRGIESASQLSDEPAPIVADVATDPNGSVLEEGTGYIAEIYVVVPVEDKLRIARGGVYTHYEFPWPLRDRLTDEKWREMISYRSEKKPDLADWTDAYIVIDEK